MKYLLTILMAIMLSAICNTLTAQQKSIEVSVDVEKVNGEEQRNITVTIGDGSTEKEIAWKDNGEIPAEIKAQLEKEGVDIKMLEGDGEVEVTVKDNGEKKIEKEVEIIEIHSTNESGNHSQDREINIDDDGDIMIIKLKDGEELPEDVKKILEEHDIDIEELKKEKLHEGHEKETKMMQKKAIKIKTKDSDGNETIMEWNGDGDGEVPADIQKLLEEEGIEIEGSDHKMIFIENDSDVKDIKISKETSKQYRIKTIDEDGNEKVIEWNGEGEMPEEMKKHKELFKKEKKVIKKKLKSSSNRAQLGVMVEETDARPGVRVIDVIKNSPAEAAGLKTGYTITRINDDKINTIDELLSALRPHNPGDNIKLDYMYQDAYIGGVDITLGDAADISSEQEYRPNIFIFENAIDGGEFNMFKKVEKCDESGNITTTIEVSKISDEESTAINNIEKEEIPAERQLNLKSFSAFPNPTGDNINITFQGNSEPTLVKVTDISGKEIYKDVINNFNGIYNKDLDLSNFAKGQYILYVIQDQKIFTESIILQ